MSDLLFKIVKYNMTHKALKHAGTLPVVAAIGYGIYRLVKRRLD